jgi:hypothetical protein
LAHLSLLSFSSSLILFIEVFCPLASGLPPSTCNTCNHPSSGRVYPSNFDPCFF